MRNLRVTLLLLLIVIAQPRTATAEIYLGITLEQGDNGHPIVIEVRPTVNGHDTLAAFLDLKVGDEIYTAYSDPITRGDGQPNDSWTICSIANLKWVLARTTSRVGVTVKRGDKYIKAVAVYKTEVEEKMGADGRPHKVARRLWELQSSSADN